MYEALHELDDKCLIINFMKARDDPDLTSWTTEHYIQENTLISEISIICNKDKQDYLNKIKRWQKESSLVERAKEKRTPDPRGAYQMAWDDFLTDLNPNDNRNHLKGIPILKVLFIDKLENLVMPELLIKGDLDEFKIGEECMLVNHVHAFFGDYEKGDFGELIFQNYFIKNNVALLCGDEKKEYIEKVEKSQHDYFNKKENFKSTIQTIKKKVFGS